MYEANATVIGTIVNHPVKRDLPNGERVLSFRMASNSRRLDRSTGEWVDNGTLFLTVNCWRRMAAGVDASLRRGDPVIAHGQLRSLEYRTRDGMDRRDLEMRASAVGPDLGRCTAHVTRSSEMRNTGERFGAESKVPVGDGLGENVATAPAALPGTTDPEHADA
ncbi:single-strand DNA-binding protein [Nocardia tenerifensis]|uniref:Single-strand DNA-binding protein n=1 Tax=Nocardia tenerifensis TaxID=228006 RepID=A0A318JXQ7_9NOCA|nr:single-stranded DNA-binding protein [Nocardia tenerifensis]PXX59813.1 single-strand DNA-binding protein [Nocardia tenerifensis]